MLLSLLLSFFLFSESPCACSPTTVQEDLVESLDDNEYFHGENGEELNQFLQFSNSDGCDLPRIYDSREHFYMTWTKETANEEAYEGLIDVSVDVTTGAMRVENENGEIKYVRLKVYRQGDSNYLFMGTEESNVVLDFDSQAVLNRFINDTGATNITNFKDFRRNLIGQKSEDLKSDIDLKLKSDKERSSVKTSKRFAIGRSTVVDINSAVGLTGKRFSFEGHLSTCEKNSKRYTCLKLGASTDTEPNSGPTTKVSVGIHKGNKNTYVGTTFAVNSKKTASASLAVGHEGPRTIVFGKVGISSQGLPEADFTAVNKENRIMFTVAANLVEDPETEEEYDIATATLSKQLGNSSFNAGAGVTFVKGVPKRGQLTINFAPFPKTGEQ